MKNEAVLGTKNEAVFGAKKEAVDPRTKKEAVIGNRERSG
jgi:hypothetical protein